MTITEFLVDRKYAIKRMSITDIDKATLIVNQAVDFYSGAPLSQVKIFIDDVDMHAWTPKTFKIDVYVPPALGWLVLKKPGYLDADYEIEAYETGQVIEITPKLESEGTP